MRLYNNKKGIGIAAVLGIVTFVLALTTTLFTVTVNQAKMIKVSQDNSENYENSLNSIKSVIKIIENNPSILVDNRYLELETLFNVTVSNNEISNYWILTKQISESNPVNLVSYLSLSSDVELIDLGTLFKESGTYTSSDPIPKLPITADDILYAFYSELLSANNRSFIFSQNVGESMFSFVLRDAKQQQVTGATFIDYRTSLPLANNQTFTVSTGKVLFIEGNLTMNRGSRFIGKAVIGGNLGNTVDNNSYELRSTLFIGGNLSLGNITFDNTNNHVTTGFVKGSVNFRSSSGTGFFIAQSLNIQIGSGSLVGGFFLSNDGIEPFVLGGNRTIFETSIPDNLLVFESLPILTFSDGTGSNIFQYTYPRLNTN